MCIHEQNLCCDFRLLGALPQIPSGSAPKPRWGTSIPQTLSTLPQPLTPGDATG